MDVAADFRAARSFQGALDAFADCADALGFDAIDYAYMPRVRRHDGGWHAPDIASRRFPPRWQRGWRRYAALDPYLCTCYQRTLPLDWNEVKDAAWLSPVQREAIAFIDTLGFLDGITVPIHLPGGRFAFISGVSHARRGAWRARETTEQFFVLAHGFHAAAAQHLSLGGETVTTMLTSREREVLRHAADGLSAAASAQAMRRALETVRHHRKSAMEKLGARTMTQAVARALSLGLV
ncbi:MAG: autoinducer binding domain-containing protein [Gammaproteobacteria bacterium]